MTPALAYLRTSSAANVGSDSDTRQREAIQSFAERAGFEIIAEYYDTAVSGSDALEARPGFAALLDRLEANGVSTVILEDSSRLARDLLTQELGIVSLIERKVRVFTTSGDDITATDDPMKVAMRQIAGAFAQLEKARLVAKLRHARERKRLETGKCGGRKSHAERRPEAVREARRLHRASPKTGERRSLRAISRELATLGHLNERGEIFSAKSVRAMLGQR